MNEDLSDSNALLAEAKALQLYDNLVVQLEKDFGLANSCIELRKGIPPEELRKTIHEKVYVLLMENLLIT